MLNCQRDICPFADLKAAHGVGRISDVRNHDAFGGFVTGNPIEVGSVTNSHEASAGDFCHNDSSHRYSNETSGAYQERLQLDCKAMHLESDRPKTSSVSRQTPSSPGEQRQLGIHRELVLERPCTDTCRALLLHTTTRRNILSSPLTWSDAMLVVWQAAARRRT